jgi:hypothetical protein
MLISKEGKGDHHGRHVSGVKTFEKSRQRTVPKGERGKGGGREGGREGGRASLRW